MKYRTFQPQFYSPIRARIKISTIRGKAWGKVGERVALRYWTGAPYRSPMGILGTAVVDLVEPLKWDGCSFYVSGISDDLNHRLARQEGFASRGAMIDWFEETHGASFEGVLTRWDPVTLVLVDEVKP